MSVKLYFIPKQKAVKKLHSLQEEEVLECLGEITLNGYTYVVLGCDTDQNDNDIMPDLILSNPVVFDALREMSKGSYIVRLQ